MREMIECKDVFKYDDIKELRKLAFEYYKNNLQGKYFLNLQLGKILFSRRGIDKFISSSANRDKLIMVSVLSKIIELGEYVGSEKPTHERKDGIIKFHRINTTIEIHNKIKEVSLLVAEDRNDKIFYNLNNDVEWYKKNL
jgi:hypothetical protein